MARDSSNLFPSAPKGDGTKQRASMIETLGWQNYFAQQSSVDELALTPPVRVVEVHRSGLHVVGNDINEHIPPNADFTIGDWLLLDRAAPQSSKLLQRSSLLKRRAAGHDRKVQLIAANVDTVFIVSSCNQDLNIARLERYVALAYEAEITPVIILTKSDLVTSTDEFTKKARAISDTIPIILLNARSDEPKEKLAQWCKRGRTVAFLGSSGVGKSTLANALIGNEKIETQAIREDDAKGRHTTTSRQLHIVPDGCVVLDTPGMRELQLTDTAAGIEDVFADLYELSTQCKFNDCKHTTEPGCAVLKSIENDPTQMARLERWRKLIAEETFNSATLAERKLKDKVLGKTIRAINAKNKKK